MLKLRLRVWSYVDVDGVVAVTVVISGVSDTVFRFVNGNMIVIAVCWCERCGCDVALMKCMVLLWW